MITVFVLLAILPFAALANWFRFIKRLPPREQNLARASHGAGMLAVAIIVLMLIGGTQGVAGFLNALAANPKEPKLWGSALAWVVLVGWGFGWLVIGSARSRGPRDALLISRALVKIAVGVALDVLAHGGYLPSGWLGVTLTKLVEFWLFPVAVWCMVTGITKLVLLLRGSGGSAEEAVKRSIESKRAPLVAAKRRNF